MLSKKLALVQVSDTIGDNLILPLAIGILWSYAKNKPGITDKWQLGNIIYQPAISEDQLKDLASHDMVCFSTYVWNASYHVDIAAGLKKINPRCFVVFGGPHFTERWDDFWLEFSNIIDLVLLGDGEESFVRLLENFPDTQAIAAIPGCWTATQLNEPAPRVDLAGHIESPYLDGFYDSIIQHCHSHDITIQAVIQTNRGCPYHCTFCEEGAEYKNKVFQYPEQRIKDEITWCGQNKIEFLSLADDNWGIMTRDIDLMEHICQTASQYGFPKILDATWAKNNPKNVTSMAELDKKYGTNLINGVTVALQSLNYKTLHEIKRFNLVEYKQAEFVQRLRQLDVPIYVEIIWPLPFETYQSLCAGIDSVIAQGMDTWIALYPLTMQTSADLYHDFKDRYQFAQPNDQEDTRSKSHLKMNAPMSSDWADHTTVVRGHVFYMWLTTVYFFGFARPALDFIRERKDGSVSDAINSMMDHIDNLPGDHPLYRQQLALTKYWSDWLTNRTSVEIAQFPDRDTDFWYPFTHHASWLQINHESWLQYVHTWLGDTYDYDELEISKVVESCRHSTVKFGQQYPYQIDQKTITLDHQPPELVDLFEFCRYYYWYKRKRGYSRTCVLNNAMQDARMTA